MPLTERPSDNDVRDFLGGGTAKPRAKKKAVGDRTYLLHLPADDMAKVKIAAAKRGETMKEFFARVIAQACREEEYKSRHGYLTASTHLPQCLWLRITYSSPEARCWEVRFPIG